MYGIISLLDMTSYDNIRIHHKCEGGIEKSVLKITNWHYEACRVMTNGDREDPILTQIMNSFSCSPLNTFFLLAT